MVDGFRGQRLTRSCNRRSRLQNAIVGAVIALIGLGWGDDWRVALALLLGVALLGWIVQRRKCHSSINATQGAQRPLSPPTPSRCRCEAIRLDWVYAGFAGWVDAWLPTDLFGALNCRFASNWARFCNPRIDAESRRLARAEASDPTAGAGIAARIDRGIVAEAHGAAVHAAIRGPRFAARGELPGQHLRGGHGPARLAVDPLRR